MDHTLASPSALGEELREGLARRPLSIPSKYFYDDRGSALFDAICDLPEYYPTRTEQALLDQVAGEIAIASGGSHLVELGAGTARKTGVLIDALLSRGATLRYTPLDISRYALEQAGASLAERFPALEVEGIRCDYTRTLEPLEPDPGSLTLFLGSTIGNFTHERAVGLLRRLRDRLAPGDGLLLGLDLVKPRPVLEAAYNDSQGVTAAFNRNILRVVNREAAGDFDPEAFRHLAFFSEEASRIEMHLVACREMRVNLEALAMELELARGESILTEISRKFTRESAMRLLGDSGFRMRRWFVSDDGYFALALAAAKEGTEGARGNGRR